MQIDLSDLFLSTEIWGLFGVFAMIAFGMVVLTNKRYKPVGGLWIIIELITLAKYFAMVSTTPFYWWDIIILILGVFVSAFQMASR